MKKKKGGGEEKCGVFWHWPLFLLSGESSSTELFFPLSSLFLAPKKRLFLFVCSSSSRRKENLAVTTFFNSIPRLFLPVSLQCTYPEGGRDKIALYLLDTPPRPYPPTQKEGSLVGLSLGWEETIYQGIGFLRVEISSISRGRGVKSGYGIHRNHYFLLQKVMGRDFIEAEKLHCN